MITTFTDDVMENDEEMADGEEKLDGEEGEDGEEVDGPGWGTGTEESDDETM